MKKTIYFISIFTLIIISLTLYKTQAVSQPQPKIAIVKKGHIKKTLHERGTFVAKEQVNLFSPLTGTLQHIHIKEGDFVRKNQPLMNFNPHVIQHKLNQITYELESESLRLNQLQDDKNRKQKLVEKHIITTEEYDHLLTKIQLSNIQKKALQDTQSNLQNQLHHHQINTPIEGRITNIHVTEGQNITVGRPLIEIQDTQSLQIQATINDYQAHQMKIGQTVEIFSPGIPNPPLIGTLTHISPHIETTQAQNGLSIIITPSSPTHHLSLYPGSKADLKIMINTAKPCLFLPIEAVHKSDHHYWVKDATTGKKRSISIGIQNQHTIEILSGLSEGEGVIID